MGYFQCTYRRKLPSGHVNKFMEFCKLSTFCQQFICPLFFHNLTIPEAVHWQGILLTSNLLSATQFFLVYLLESPISLHLAPLFLPLFLYSRCLSYLLLRYSYSVLSIHNSPKYSKKSYVHNVSIMGGGECLSVWVYVCVCVCVCAYAFGLSALIPIQNVDSPVSYKIF